MQQIVVDLIVVTAALFLARMIYRNFVVARREKSAGCPGCGSCEEAKKNSAVAPKS
jgi:hypothetical protein